MFHFLKLQLVTLFQWSIGKQRWTISLKPAGRNLPQTMGIFWLLRANRWSVLWLPVTNYPVWSSIKERIDWCPVLMLSSTQAQTWVMRGSEWGIPGYWATLYLRLTLITLPIYYSFCLSGCPSVFDADSGFIPGTLLHLPAFCRSINIGALRGLILCSYLGQECNRTALKQIARQITLHFEDEPFRKPVLCNL